MRTPMAGGMRPGSLGAGNRGERRGSLVALRDPSRDLPCVVDEITSPELELEAELERSVEAARRHLDRILRLEWRLREALTELRKARGAA